MWIHAVISISIHVGSNFNYYLLHIFTNLLQAVVGSKTPRSLLLNHVRHSLFYFYYNIVSNMSTAVGTFNNLRNENLDTLRDILESSYEDLLASVQSIGKSDDAFINPSQVDRDRSNFNKIKSYYKSCMDETTIDSLGPTPIYPGISKLVKKLGFSENEDGRFTTDHVRQLTEALIYLGKEGVDNLITFGVAVDDINPDEYSISVTQPSLGLPSREYYDQPEMLTSYRNGLISILSSVLGSPKNSSAREEIRRIKLSESKLNSLSQVEVENIVDRFIDFESHLAKLTLPK